ncbi:hypothetical protein STBHUCCB_p2130 (plasmid) [Salmonella enterica subsp. enterica serovar Typhi str. P-stx-12]|nr:hypothetical protein STBHUCCB_p2130 [Salmonella enterica subsp. enterica serovar Typhi str. P-stx-12]
MQQGQQPSEQYFSSSFSFLLIELQSNWADFQNAIRLT